MKLNLSTFNGTSITPYLAKLVGGPFVSRARVINIPRVNDVPVYAAKSFDPALITLAFTLRKATLQADMEAVAKLFHTHTADTQVLVGLDANDSNVQYYLDCTPVEFPPIDGSLMKVVVWTADPVWKKVTASTKQIDVAGSGTTTDTVTNNGTVDAYPSIAITPAVAGGAHAYRRHVIVYNPTAAALPHYPLEVTGGGINSGALVGDTAVSNLINEAGNINSSVTTWNIDTSVGGGLNAAGGTFYVDSEQCSYTLIAAGVISGVTRGINGTTAASHLNNATMKRSLIQADGDDIQVLDAGTTIERWFGGVVATASALKIWSSISFLAPITGTLKTALGANGESKLAFTATAALAADFVHLPAKGILLVENECIAYTAKNGAALTVTIANSTRAVKDTTAAAHAAGVTIRWIQHDLVIMYGNLTYATPVQTDKFKPVFSLINSTNVNWRYDSADSFFADEAGLRGGGWKPSKPKGKHSDWYGGNEGVYGTDPITDMGAEIVSFQASGVYKSETGQIWWTLTNPCGFTLISSLGEKYKYAANTTWPLCRLLSSVNGITWVVEWSEAVPGSAATWTAWTHAAEAVPSGTKYLRFELFGSVNPAINQVARNEVNLGAAGSMGVTMETTGVPQITLKSEKVNAHINVTISNTTTGDSFTYSFPMEPATALTIDTLNRIVTYEGRNLAPPELDGVRQEWLRLAPGSNTITYYDSVTGAVTVVFSYNERKNL